MEKDKQVCEVREDEHIDKTDDSKTYRRKTCEGHLYLTIARKEGRFDYILITPPSKTNDCGSSWAIALQDLLTFSLRRIEGEKDFKLILKALSGHYCNAMPPNKSHCRSCPDAVASILKEDFVEIF